MRQKLFCAWVSVSEKKNKKGNLYHFMCRWGILSISSTHLFELTRRLQTGINQMFGTATFAIDGTTMGAQYVVNKSREAWTIFYVHRKARDRILAWDGWIKESPNQKNRVAFTGTNPVTHRATRMGQENVSPNKNGACGEVEIHQLWHGFQTMKCTPNCLGCDDRGAIQMHILHSASKMSNKIKQTRYWRSSTTL